MPNVSRRVNIFSWEQIGRKGNTWIILEATIKFLCILLTTVVDMNWCLEVEDRYSTSMRDKNARQILSYLQIWQKSCFSNLVPSQSAILLFLWRNIWGTNKFIEIKTFIFDFSTLWITVNALLEAVVWCVIFTYSKRNPQQ